MRALPLEPLVVDLSNAGVAIRIGPQHLIQLCFLVTAGDTPGQRGPEWIRIAGGPGTGCSHDSSYSFFFHPGDERRLVIFFQGGGACWNGQNCDLNGRPSFDSQIDTTDDPKRQAGLLDLSNPRNPIRDYSVVYVPYCTADVFLGARTNSYATRSAADTVARRFQIRHRGRANADRVVGWVYSHFAKPNLVFVTGTSAGAIATPFYASLIARYYPRARVVQLGDAAGGYRAEAIPGILAHWGATSALKRDAAYRGIDSATMTFETLYAVAARTTPRVTFAQYNSAEDNVQLSFLSMLGVHDVPLARLLAANHADIRRANPALRTYTIPGHMHTILLRPEFYTLAVDGIAIRDWVAGLLDGTRVADVGQALLR